MLMRVGGKLLGTDSLEYVVGARSNEHLRLREIRYLWVGVLINTIALFWAMSLLFTLTRALGDRDQAAAAVMLCLSWPFAFVFSMPYTEALFLLVSVASFDAIRRGRIGTAIGWGLVGGLTRPNGFFLGIPLGLIGLGRLLANRMPRLARSIDRLSPAPEPPHSVTAAVMKYGTVAAAPLAGMLAFSAYLYTLTGVPFGWAAVHASGWERTFIGFEPFVRPFRRILFETTLYDYTRYDPIELLNAAPFFLAVALIVPIMRRVGIAYGLLIPLMLFPPVAAGGWVSVGRFTAVLFPIFIYLGLALPPAWRAPIAASFAAMQALAAGLFFTWHQLY
jgi:hypothetical protein